MHRSQVQGTGVASPNSAEGVIATVPAVALGENPLISGVIVDAAVNFLAGLATTAVVFRVRRGAGTASTLIGTPQTVTLAAGATASAAIAALDTTPVSGTGYVITAQQTGGTGPGSAMSIVASATAS